MLLAEAGIDADGHNFQMCHRNLISSPPLALPSLQNLLRAPTRHPFLQRFKIHCKNLFHVI